MPPYFSMDDAILYVLASYILPGNIGSPISVNSFPVEIIATFGFGITDTSLYPKEARTPISLGLSIVLNTI
jgi:hypothetical protein